uniref:Palmitoyltransferase n=1 Tax=Haptolina brevifila TaxID=156173 RepID=A0A7S2DAC2_9EUKA
MALFAMCKRVDATSTAGVADVQGAAARAVRCRVCRVLVPRYDHYCSWIDEPVGAVNHRAYLGFITAMLATGAVGSWQLLGSSVVPGASQWAALRSNQSSLRLSFGLYGLAVTLAVGALLAHQLTLVSTGRTAYEARDRGRGPHTCSSSGDGEACRNSSEGSGNWRGGSTGAQAGWVAHWRCFARQTSPLSVLLTVVLAGRGGPPTGENEPLCDGRER